MTAVRCPSGKHAYARRSDAKYAMKRIQSIPGRNVRAVYQCPHCDAFHLTHHTPSVSKSIDRARANV